MKSQLYASIGIMAGSYAHNIKNLLVRPNDLLARCLEVDGLSDRQQTMLGEVRQTLGTVTERLQQILRTVRRDPSRAELTRIDLTALLADTARTWEDLAREKWKVTLTCAPAAEPLVIDGDASHLQQAVENLLFNARDATFEMRNHLRDAARRTPGLDADARRRALIDAAGWRGQVDLRAWRDGDHAVLEVRDNGIGMSAEVRARCTQTHFSTKRDNALYEGYNAGMGLGLSFTVVVLEHHGATLEIDSEPLHGAAFRVRFPLAGESQPSAAAGRRPENATDGLPSAGRTV
jgi:signal transduction histidine kinase